VETELRARDLVDSTRDASPLMPALDAVRLDTTGLSVDEVVDRVMRIVDEKRHL
jgi:cytidylate kinase